MGSGSSATSAKADAGIDADTKAGDDLYKAVFSKISKFDYEDTLKKILQSTTKPNILVCGGTGTGKSSLINYLFGLNLPTGAGLPVTARGLHEQVVLQDGVEYHVFDTWGLEAGEAGEWKNRILEEAAERNHSLNLAQWFHGVFYCVNASAARVEQLEMADVVAPLWRQRCPVTVVLTHAAGSVNKNDKIRGLVMALLQSLRKEIPDFPVANIVPVSSVSGETFAGDHFVQFGREELLAAATALLAQNLAQRVPRLIRVSIEGQVNDWQQRSEAVLDRAEFGYVGRNGKVAKLIQAIDTDLQQTYVEIDADALRLRRKAAAYTHAVHPLPGCQYKKYQLRGAAESWRRYLCKDDEIKAQLRALVAQVVEKVNASIVEGELV